MSNSERNSTYALEYYADSRPKEPRTEIRLVGISTLVGECIVSLDTKTIIQGVEKIFPVLENERDQKVHQNATNGAVGLIYVLSYLDMEQNELVNLAKQTLTFLTLSRPNMVHTPLAIKRIEEIFGFKYTLLAP